MARPGADSADDGSESVSPPSGPGRGELGWCTMARIRDVFSGSGFVRYGRASFSFSLQLHR